MYAMDSTDLEQVCQKIDLEVIMGVYLKFHNHAAATANTITQILPVIREPSAKLHNIHLHLECGKPIWNLHCKLHQQTVKELQRTTTLTCQLCYLPYEETLPSKPAYEKRHDSNVQEHD